MSILWQPIQSNWTEIAEALGFTHDASGCWTRRQLELTSEGRWLVLTSRDALTGDPLRDLLGAPGPWRSLRCADQWTLGCEIPLVSSRRGESAPIHASLASLESLVAWAEATADGAVPSDFRPPATEQLVDWIPPRQRSLRAGSLTREIEVIVSAARLTLAVSSLVRLPEDLSPARRSWIDELCRNAQQSWRLVRFGIDEGQSRVRAEIDLTGVPCEEAEPLAGLGLAALTAAAVWALPGLAIAADTGIESQVLERGPSSKTSQLGATTVVPRFTPDTPNKRGATA